MSCGRPDCHIWEDHGHFDTTGDTNQPKRDWSEEVRARLDQASRGRAELRFCLPVQASDLQAALGEIERQDGLLLEWADKWRESQAEVERLRKQVEHWKAQAADVARCHIDAIARAERAEAALDAAAIALENQAHAVGSWHEDEMRMDAARDAAKAARAALREEEKP